MGTTEPPCDSCCEPAPPVDKEKMTCSALDKKYIMLAKNMEDDCSAVDTDDGDDGLCDQLTFEVVPKCMELFCDNEGRDGKNQCLTPLAQVVWWNYLTCATAQPLGQLGCIYFLQNQQCFNTWAVNPRP